MSSEKTIRPGMLILLVIAALEPLGETMHTSAFTVITQFFNIIPSVTQLSTILYILAFAVSMLIYGTLSDRYGRKPILLIGIGLYIVGAITCAFSSNYDVFLLGKVMQGIGGGAGALLVRTIIRESYSFNEQRKAFIYVSAAIAISPMVAPIVGGVFVQFFHWQGIFKFMAILGSFVLLFVFLTLPETLKDSESGSTFRQQFKKALPQLKNKQIVTHVIISSLLSAAVLIFFINAPFIFIGKEHVTAVSYGLMLLIPSSAFFIGSCCANVLSRWLTVGGEILIGLAISVMSILLMLVMYHQYGMHPVSILTPISLLLFGISFVKPNLAFACLEPVCHDIAFVCSILKLIQTGLMSVLAFVPDFIPVDDLHRMPVSMLIMVLISLGVAMYYYFPPKLSISKLGSILFVRQRQVQLLPVNVQSSQENLNR